MLLTLDNLQLTEAVFPVTATITGISVDTRTLQRGDVYFALRGEHLDGHDYLQEAAEKGAAAVVVDHLPDEGLPVPAMVVPDTQQALEVLAGSWRERFNLPVIGVTGSNGKTTVKGMIASILEVEYGSAGYLATQGNLNNAIGVPLTVSRLTSDMKAAVVELGMNHPGEIRGLASVALPTIGLVNNAQREHQEFMQTVDAVALENGSVISSLPQGGIAVFPADDEYTPLWRKLAKQADKVSVLTFGLSDNADVQGAYTPAEFGSLLTITVGKRDFTVSLKAAGEHNVLNALAATACAVATGVSYQAIRQGLESFSPVKGRLQRKTASCGATVIDDTYNANPDSVRAAIAVLSSFPGPRLLVLGDMGEVGDDGPEFHAEVGAYAKSRGIERLYTLGELSKYTIDRFGCEGRHFQSMEDLCKALTAVATPGMTVLVKGSRFMRMERAVQHLVEA